ncbi:MULTISPECIES: ammonia-forming cytochrome c nitrite reductase subunit c552 [Actinomyces]|nr:MULTISPECIES: ammonia-forming cytochrome c nitrite reductase subunit c552 [Actinomyces]
MDTADQSPEGLAAEVERDSATSPARDARPGERAARHKRSFFRGPVFMVLLMAVVAGATFVVTMLLMSINNHQAEGSRAFYNVAQLDETSYDPAVWGQNYPVQYADYKKTAEFTPAEHAGKMVPHSVEGDPRTEVKSQKLEEDPRLVKMWSGYAFAVDYRHARGHAYTTVDQQYTLRNAKDQQPGTCANCHVSAPALYDKLGNGDREAGFEATGTMKLSQVLADESVSHPVACIDCHDPKTMALRVTRPSFMRGIKALKASQGVSDFEVNKDATPQEMRTYVCAQCHVEYYFKGENKVLTFPWDKGIDIDNIYSYYQEQGFTDWTHEKTGAPMLKAQHPEFDIWSNSVHAANGVGCADCHMNYKRVGSGKVSNHHVTTPMKDVNASCGTCHKTGDGVIEKRVRTIQANFISSRDRAFDTLVGLISDLEAAKSDGTSPEQIALAQQYQRKASFYLDYVYSENSYGFHAPDYEQRIINQAEHAAQNGRLALTGKTAEELKDSDVSTANAEHYPSDKAASGASRGSGH